mgnify:CR=1 FL=1
MNMAKRIALVLLALVMLSGICTACAEESFSFRGGVKFGMSPQEVISVEESHGFYHDYTNSGDLLYVTNRNKQLYYQDKELGCVGTMPIMRFEYDFDLNATKMYQFYYVFKSGEAYDYLRPSLIQKYGAPATGSTFATERFTEAGEKYVSNHSCWVLEYENETVVIDLWDNQYSTCFLVYQSFNVNQLKEEQALLDFGL